MARVTKRKTKKTAKAARPAKKKAPARKKAAPRKVAARAAAPSPKTAELQAEIRRLRLEITALQAKLGEVPAITFDAPAADQATV